MPRKTKLARKKATGGLRDSCVEKLTAIAESTEKETFEDLIKDFDIQSDKLVRQTVRLFSSETKKLTRFLPQKTGIPKEILKMSAYEFKERGGTLGAVLESWRTDKQLRSNIGTTLLNPATNKENEVKSAATNASVEIDPDFVTPALSTRSKVKTEKDLKSTAGIIKRKPNPLEDIAVYACSTNTGSPVDEEAFMDVQFSQALEDMESQLLQSTLSFPQKWRSQLQKSIRCARLQVKSQMQDSYFQTPALKH